jgi:DNA-directed RNA polymerase specialized sigma24 family protein
MQGTDAGIVDRLTQTLTRVERHILMLYYCEELTADEIGVVLDLPVNRVLGLLEDLRERTRRALAQWPAAVA